MPSVSKVAITSMIIRTCDQFFNLVLLTSDCETRVLLHDMAFKTCAKNSCMYAVVAKPLCINMEPPF